MSTTQAIHTSEIWLHRSQKPDLLRPSTQCPSYRFSCPECGSLDVFLSQPNPVMLIGQCLDCQSKWEEEVNV